MTSSSRRIVTAAAAALALAGAAPAHAAYAPRLSVTVDPPTAGAPAALAVDVFQESGEEATQALRIALPSFAVGPGVLAWPACTGAAESASTCPATSRIGSATSTTSFGDFAGDAFYGGLTGESPRILVFLKNARVPVVLDQKLEGRLEAVPGGQELVFENLPGATATHFALRLDARGRALVAAPQRCGNFDLLGRFTSAAGGHEESGSRVSIGGCPGAKPSITRATLSPRNLRQGARTTLAFWLSEPASVRVTMRQSGKRRVRTLRRLAGRAGRNRVTGLGRGLAPGRYFFTIKATTAEGSAIRGLALRVAARRR